jgi:uncharacterized membrane-anchored protein YhcB (DUF1043 family)
MGKISWFRAILSVIVGLVIGTLVIAVANLIRPAQNIVESIIVVGLVALLSSFSGYVLGARQKKN